ncbi:hypothetical protein JQ594_28355 [Bradyrhizobium manausense]|uniref:hypothetical protein n=1 Tax=Bradyrhizobium manausense TaxID=989370 RepID=UPI001BA600BC|nr:hypothetical protein [Bradyrhizobium manausense]MBR0689855.1 hypothetical protein [Bradyrhizobium manausense]
MPEIFVDYLRRLNTTTGTYVQKVPDPAFVEAAQIAATVSLGKKFVPGDFLASEVLEVLSKEGFESQAQLLLDQLVGAGVIERRAPGGYVLLRFSLDPAAEYLAAIRQIIKLRSADSKRWRGYLATLRKVDGYPSAIEGYLNAFANCYGSLRQELQLLEVSFPWEEDEWPQQTPSHSSTFEQRFPY